MLKITFVFFVLLCASCATSKEHGDRPVTWDRFGPIYKPAHRAQSDPGGCFLEDGTPLDSVCDLYWHHCERETSVVAQHPDSGRTRVIEGDELSLFCLECWYLCEEFAREGHRRWPGSIPWGDDGWYAECPDMSEVRECYLEDM